jgi:hypothetical protein
MDPMADVSKIRQEEFEKSSSFANQVIEKSLGFLEKQLGKEIPVLFVLLLVN